MSSFLSYVVTESLAGRIDHLKGYTIGVDVFGKPEGFDPQTDTIVRVQARVLRQKLEQYYAQEGAHDPVRISIAKGSYEPTFFVPSKDTKSVANTPNAPLPETIRPSIAVLPFDDFSANPDHKRFSDCLTEDIISNLSCFKELQVFSRLTTSKAKEDKLCITQIYSAFRPDFVVEGSFRITEQSVVVTYNLVAGQTGEVILTQHYNRDVTPQAIFEIQDEMASMIAVSIADRFGPIGNYADRAVQRGRSLKWETYHWICLYHQQTIELSATDRLDIKVGLTKALEADSTASDAHATLALVLIDEWRTAMQDRPNSDLLQEAIPHAQMAVMRDPQNATAHEAMAMVWFYRKEDKLFEASAALALELNPGHSDLLAMMGLCYAIKSNWDRALPLLDKAIALNPLYEGWARSLKVACLIMMRKYQEALDDLVNFPSPGQLFYHCNLVWLLSEMGDMERSAAEREKLLTAFPDAETVVLHRAKALGFGEIWINRLRAALHMAGLEMPNEIALCS